MKVIFLQDVKGKGNAVRSKKSQLVLPKTF